MRKNNENMLFSIRKVSRFENILRILKLTGFDDATIH
jgi:hypothetical protein